MPFQSQAQRRKFYAMADKGEISQATVDRWEEETPKGKKLPERKTKKNAFYLAGCNAAIEKLGGIPGALLGTGVGMGAGAIAADPGQRTRGALIGGALGAGVGAGGEALMNRFGLVEKARKMMGAGTHAGEQAAASAAHAAPAAPPVAAASGMGSEATQSALQELRDLGPIPAATPKAPSAEVQSGMREVLDMAEHPQIPMETGDLQDLSSLLRKARTPEPPIQSPFVPWG